MHIVHFKGSTIKVLTCSICTCIISCHIQKDKALIFDIYVGHSLLYHILLV